MKNADAGLYTGSFFLLVLSISLATFMSSLDGTIVNIALPTISQAFDISSTTVSWVATAYLLVMAGCVLIFGKISDVIGFKRVFLAGFVIFTLGSFACGLLPVIFDSFFLLVGSRVFQAVGGAMITAIAPAMVTAYIPMDKKGKGDGDHHDDGSPRDRHRADDRGDPDRVYLVVMDILHQCAGRHNCSAAWQ